MPLLDGGLRDIFGAAFGALYLDATHSKSTLSDTGGGGFAIAGAIHPVKAMVSALSDRARAESGLPLPAVTISLLRAGTSAAIDLDDLVSVAGLVYRVVRVEEDPAGVAWSVVAVPAHPA